MDGTNWYGYCSNNPVMYVDPTGLSDEIINQMVSAAKDYMDAMVDSIKIRGSISFPEIKIRCGIGSINIGFDLVGQSKASDSENINYKGVLKISYGIKEGVQHRAGTNIQPNVQLSIGIRQNIEIADPDTWLGKEDVPINEILSMGDMKLAIDLKGEVGNNLYAVASVRKFIGDWTPDTEFDFGELITEGWEAGFALKFGKISAGARVNQDEIKEQKEKTVTVEKRMSSMFEN